MLVDIAVSSDRLAVQTKGLSHGNKIGDGLFDCSFACWFAEAVSESDFVN